ncbi:reverse transcriptase domain-containing protein [Tanacetum coccineum]
MTTVNQGMSVEEIKQVVAQRVANAIEAIAIYEAKTNMARKSMSQTKRQEDKVAKNASNKRKLEADTAGPGEKKEYAGTLLLCNKSNFHHNGQCTVKCANCKRVGHLTRDCRSPATTNNQRNLTCYECGNQGHYRSDCPERKNQNHENQTGGTGARGVVHALGGGETDQDPNNIEDEIEA